MKNDLLPYKIGLTLIPGVGGVIARRLVAFCGGVEAVYSEKRRAMLKIPGIGRTIAEAISNHNILEKARREADYVRKKNITTLFYLDDGYPSRLKLCNDSPILIYTKGKFDLENSRILAVVGTRNATAYGKEITSEMMKGLSGSNVLIISGLAYGIDAFAHKFALENDLPTVAVLGHGLDRIYPQANYHLAKEMLGNGGLITDFPSGCKPERENFPKRNRIIAGLADAVLVVEASKKGGALITADIAGSYNRDVFAVPGKVSEKFSAGCNWIIKTNRAALVENAGDIIYNMGWDEATSVKKPKQFELPFGLSDGEIAILELIKNNSDTGIDELCHSSGMNPSQVSEYLLRLEFGGIIKCMPGKVFRLVD